MQIQSRESGGVTIISPAGSIDAHTSSDLNAYMAQLAGSKQWVFDLGQVDFMSSAGLRVILATAKDARHDGGDLRLAAPQSGVLKTLKMSGFTSIARTFDTVDEAVESFSSR